MTGNRRENLVSQWIFIAEAILRLHLNEIPSLSCCTYQSVCATACVLTYIHSADRSTRTFESYK
ncbi:unnamed protein product [Periconia digitata]|uniref:Uncharacterized protein n=1 Tax=Periconia digitata TaxID=1303443 RepID=A0A9W4XQV4_9PLEO|nr:unnamed protein product [Periconia digitata]